MTKTCTNVLFLLIREERGSFDGGKDDEYNGIGLVEIRNIIYSRHQMSFTLTRTIWQISRIRRKQISVRTTGNNKKIGLHKGYPANTKKSLTMVWPVSRTINNDQLWRTYFEIIEVVFIGRFHCTIWMRQKAQMMTWRATIWHFRPQIRSNISRIIQRL